MNLTAKQYDAVVVGSGPNGLSAAIVLARAGLSVVVLEAQPTIGGGTRSAELTLPGFVHDLGSAIHPMAVSSPLFDQLPLAEHGLAFIYPPVALAHPFDGSAEGATFRERGVAAALAGSVADTARTLGPDEETYRNLLEPIVAHWPTLAADILGPLRFPDQPIDFARFGLNAILPATQLAKRFRTSEARGLLAGVATHAIQPLTNLTTSAITLAMMAAGHYRGWPLPKGGSQTIANALASYFQSLGGEIVVDRPVRSLSDLPKTRVVLFDLTPKQLLRIVGDRFPYLYRKQLEHYRYGPGIFKIDWALDGPIPFEASVCRQAGTVHLGGTLEEIVAIEEQISQGQHPDRPHVLLAQQSLFDDSRAPAGKHTAWAYCHVPNGSTIDMTDRIERQVERFAPGFRDLILARHTMNTTQIETWNPNYVGGDINGGIIDLGQLYTRPSLSLTPYRTAAPGLFICSSATPPGGGVHGMCGYHAARIALRNGFGKRVPDLSTRPAALPQEV